jgi:GAF domain-containing protein
MELLPQSREALDEYVTASIDDMEGLLRVIEGWAVRSVPECVALSVTLLDEDLTFTLVDREAAAAAPRDEPQHDEPHDEPHHQARGAGPGPPADSHPLDELDWADMARERAFGTIASTVCLPVVEHGRAVLNIDLYASTTYAFRDRIEGLVEALGAWQAGAVTNADLGFETLRRAQHAPEQLREQRLIDVAVGLVAARMAVTTETAALMLGEAAERAGVSESDAASVARVLLA